MGQAFNVAFEIEIGVDVFKHYFLFKSSNVFILLLQERPLEMIYYYRLI